MRLRIVTCLLTLALAHGARAQAPRPAEADVAASNRAVLSQLPFADRQAFEDARRGFIATVPDGPSPGQYDFLSGDAPATVNPSLWRLAQLNALHGLFKVVDGLYQVRGFSLANMTIVEGRTGVIVIDPLSTVGSAREALELYFAHRPRRPVTAVVYTHSHSDHYGGVKGVATDADVAAGRTRVIAPAGFMEAAVSESVIAGNAMGRRAQYQFGAPLPRGPRGNVDAGLGKIDSRGLPGRSIIAPTDSIEKPLDSRMVDGVPITFQMAPGSEAPAEMHLYFPSMKVLDAAENATQTLHNLLPLRGTEVRDAKGWSRYLSDALEQFGGEAEVLIAQHHWPVWGQGRVVDRLRKQRDLYKYIHDQTVRLMNQGLAPAEIAEQLRLPESLEQEWSARGYYGTVSHDSKAVYQRYLGWYDGNPAVLNALPPVDAARKYVDYMGGPEAVLARARDDYRRGEYRWVAQVMDQVVYADPANAAARALAADAYEQLGYLAESATWRNAYLLGAQELRGGVRPAPRRQALDAEMIGAMRVGLVFDYLGTTLNGPRAGKTHLVLQWRLTDTGEEVVSTVENGALTWVAGRAAGSTQATIALTRAAFESLVLRQRTPADAQARGDLRIEGDAARLAELFALFDDVDPAFPIVEPRAPALTGTVPRR